MMESDKMPQILHNDEKLDGTDVDYYNDAAKYWEGVDGTVNGMLGGFGKVSDADIDGSNKLLKQLFKVRNYFWRSMACESLASFNHNCGSYVPRFNI